MGETASEGGVTPSGAHETAAQHPEAGENDLGGCSQERGGPPSAAAGPAGLAGDVEMQDASGSAEEGENAALLAALEVPEGSGVRVCRFCAKPETRKKELGIGVVLLSIKNVVTSAAWLNVAGLDIGASGSLLNCAECRHKQGNASTKAKKLAGQALPGGRAGGGGFSPAETESYLPPSAGGAGATTLAPHAEVEPLTCHALSAPVS